MTNTIKSKQKTSDLIRIALKANQPMLIRGKRGVGKSQTIKSVCEEEGYKVIVRNLNGAESYEVVSGLPRQVNESFSYLTPQWWTDISNMVANGEKVVLFLDEINHALPEVLNGLHGVLDPERRIAGLEIPEIRIIAAGNMAEENEYLTEMPLPLLDRFAIKVEDFKNEEAREYLKKKYADMVGIIDLAFSGSNPNPRQIEKMLNCIKNGLTDKGIIATMTDEATAESIFKELENGEYSFSLVNESKVAVEKDKLVKELKEMSDIDIEDILRKIV